MMTHKAQHAILRLPSTRQGWQEHWKPIMSAQRGGTPATRTLTSAKARTISTSSSPHRSTERKSTFASRRRGAASERTAPCLWIPSSPPVRSFLQAEASRRYKPISPKRWPSWRRKWEGITSFLLWYIWMRKLRTFTCALHRSRRTPPVGQGDSG